MEDYRAYIDTLPLNTPPEVFGLHSNANLTKAIAEGVKVLNDSAEFLGGFGAAASADDDDEDCGPDMKPEDIFCEIAKEFQDRLWNQFGKKYPKFDINAIKELYPVKREQCLHVVLHMELGKFNRLLAKIANTCSDLQKAVKGLVVFSPELEAISNAFLANKTPASWIGVSYPSLKPCRSYVDDLMARVQFFQNWCSNDVPSTQWFSAFFFQQALTTGSLQNFARKYNLAIDKCAWNFEVQAAKHAPEQPPDEGFFIRGLFMEGARWSSDKSKIEESMPKVIILF